MLLEKIKRISCIELQQVVAGAREGQCVHHIASRLDMLLYAARLRCYGAKQRGGGGCERRSHGDDGESGRKAIIVAIPCERKVSRMLNHFVKCCHCLSHFL